MKYDRGHRSADVEDRRGSPARRGRAAGVTGATVLVGVIVYFLFGKDAAMTVLSSGTQPTPAADGEFVATPAEEEQVSFISFVLDDIQDTWVEQFRKKGQRYERAKLVLFRDGVDSACSYQTSAVGPFYCPGDKKAYIDLSFYKDLKRRFGASGDFAEAYVLAHEIGHHVQNLLGDNARISRLQRANPSEKNALSVRLELQADCYAGVWAHATKKRDLLEKGDIEEGLNAAKAIGDDAIQRKSTGRVRPDTFTHGSSRERAKWFRIGLEKGTMDACNTFD